tara:strand:- start:5013 stop:6098 length:1086 start_codon:yes stop_codon:yes gene_type:complete
MRKILFIAPRFHTNQYYLIKNLMRKNQIYFLSLFKGKTEDYKYIKPKVIKQSYFSIKIQSLFNLRFDTCYFPNFFEYLSILKKTKPDLIIIRTYSRTLLYITSILSKVLKSNIIYYNQSPDLKYYNFISFLKYLEFNLAKFIFKAAWFSPILLKPNNKNSLPFVVKTKKSINQIKGKFKLLMIGKFQKRKNHFLLVNAIKRLKNNYNLELTIVGEVSNNEHAKNYNYINNFIIKNNLQKYCKIKKNIKFGEIEKEYINCNLFILPSHSEPAAISILEAQGYSRPVICSDSCGTKIYLNNSCSQIFRTNDINSLINSIKYFLERKYIYSNFVIRSYKNACKNFSAKKFDKDFTNFMKLNFKK